MLDASDRHGRFAVEVMAGLGARVERAALSRAALAGADVVVVGHAARAWLRRAAAWPRLVWVAVTPFGLEGPRAGWAGSELVAQAAGGMVWPNGHPGAPPLPLPGAQATRCAGLHAALGALLALLARRRDGRGRVVDVSLQESATAMLEHVAGEWFDRGDPAPRRGSLHWNGTFRVGRCRDGAVLLSHVGDWTALREWLLADGAARDLADPRWDDVDERCRHAPHVFAVLDAWAARYGVAALVEQAQLRRLPFAPVWEYARFARELGPPPTASILAPPGRGRRREGAAPDRGPGAPLHGIRVVDFTWVVAGPLATRVLADFGAEVIRVERPGARPPAGTSEANLQRGKRRLALDLGSPAGLAAARELVRGADVVVDNFSRRVLPNLGLDDDALRALNPRLIVAHLSGFPAGDPRADWAVFGPTMQAMAGLVAGMRDAGPGFAYADTATAWAAALAIVAALWRGGGARLAISQRDVLGLLLAPLLAGGASPAGGGLYRCADAGGRERWCAAAGPDARFAAWARAQPAEAAVARLQAGGVAAAVVATPADLAADPQLRARGWWRRVGGVARDGVVPRLLAGVGEME